MGRHKTDHRIKPSLVVPLKESIITDKETGNKGRGHVWSSGSYEEADRRAWEDLRRKNKEDEDDEEED